MVVVINWVVITGIMARSVVGIEAILYLHVEIIRRSILIGTGIVDARSRLIKAVFIYFLSEFRITLLLRTKVLALISLLRWISFSPVKPISALVVIIVVVINRMFSARPIILLIVVPVVVIVIPVTVRTPVVPPGPLFPFVQVQSASTFQLNGIRGTATIVEIPRVVVVAVWVERSLVPVRNRNLKIGATTEVHVVDCRVFGGMVYINKLLSSAEMRRKNVF